jgi:integrase
MPPFPGQAPRRRLVHLWLDVAAQHDAAVFLNVILFGWGRHQLNIRMLSHDEESCLLANCNPQLRPIVLTALHTGFRKSALLSLTWDDVDFHRRVITVQAASAKNGEARSVPMNDVLTMTLKAIRMNAVVDGSVLCNRNGTPYKSFRSAFEKAV